MWSEDARMSSGRRSKLEIACDILYVISRGATKPTRIMQLANVTWDDLIMYLEALIRSKFVSREVRGRFAAYSLSEKGSNLLHRYLEMRGETAELNLEAMTKERISKAMSRQPVGGPIESDALATLRAKLKSEGFHILGPSLTGRSGAIHTLDVLGVRDGSRHGYVLVRDPDETLIMKLFLTQLDSEISIHILYSGRISMRSMELAKVYGLHLAPWAKSE